MDINRIFGLHPVLKHIKAGITNILMYRDLNDGAKLKINSSFVFESEVYNIKVEISKPEKPNESHFQSNTLAGYNPLSAFSFK